MPEIAVIQQNVIEHNLYAYCKNTPNLDVDIYGFISGAILSGAIASILDLFVNIAKTAGSMSKEMKSIKDKISKAKKNGASKEWIKQLKTKKSNLMKNKGLGIGKLAAVAKILSFITTILTYIPLLKKIKDGIKAIAEIVVEVFVQLIATIGKFITSLVCKFVPSFGFLLGWGLEFLIDYIVVPLVFNSNRMSKIKQVFVKKVGNGGSFEHWVNAFGYSLKRCF